MSQRLRLRILIGSMSLVLLGAISTSVWWLIPSIHSLRTSIDNDRASSAVIIQQQSNLDKLIKDVEVIQTKQTDLEKQAWTFVAEDSFYSTIDKIGTASHVTIDSPTIADATPTGSMLTRALTITIRGSLEQVLQAVRALQSTTPLIALQKIELAAAPKTDEILLTINATTIWQ